jgi:glycosyltransferase involved in cell wall biosynthesis
MESVKHQIKKAVIFYPHIVEYGGIERNIIALATEILRQGHIPVLLCFYDDINMPGYLDGLITAKIGDHRNPFVKSFRVKKWLQENTTGILGMPFFLGGKAGFYGAVFSSNYVLHYTDPPSLLSSKQPAPGLKKVTAALRDILAHRVNHNGVKRAKVCITMTKRNAAELELLYGRAFDVIYQGGLPPSEIINREPRCSGQVLRIFSISRLTTSKNLNWILEAARHVKNTIPGFKSVEVIIAGKGPELDNLKGLANKLGLAETVSFPGFLSNEQLQEQYNNTDLFLVPAIQGYGLPILEALYRHVPVVINVESRISEILTDTPWVGISADNVVDFKNTVVNHILQLKSNYPDGGLINTLPTEQDWAINIGQKCLWW